MIASLLKIGLKGVVSSVNPADMFLLLSGYKVINGAKKIEGDGGTKIDVKLAVEYMSFSAHADAKGILQLIRTSQPRHVM